MNKIHSFFSKIIVKTKLFIKAICSTDWQNTLSKCTCSFKFLLAYSYFKKLLISLVILPVLNYLIENTFLIVLTFQISVLVDLATPLVIVKTKKSTGNMPAPKAPWLCLIIAQTPIPKNIIQKSNIHIFFLRLRKKTTNKREMWVKKYKHLEM